MVAFVGKTTVPRDDSDTVDVVPLAVVLPVVVVWSEDVMDDSPVPVGVVVFIVDTSGDVMVVFDSVLATASII